MSYAGLKWDRPVKTQIDGAEAVCDKVQCGSIPTRSLLSKKSPLASNPANFVNLRADSTVAISSTRKLGATIFHDPETVTGAMSGFLSMKISLKFSAWLRFVFLENEEFVSHRVWIPPVIPAQRFGLSFIADILRKGVVNVGVPEPKTSAAQGLESCPVTL